MMHRTLSALMGMFSTTRSLSGHEHNFHYALARQLSLLGTNREFIECEARVPGGRVDLVSSEGGREVAIELKGGAHGERNNFKAHSKAFEEDLNKLDTLRRDGYETWLAAIEIARFSGRLARAEVEDMASACHQRGHRFAFYTQGDPYARVVQDGGRLNMQEVPSPTYRRGDDGPDTSSLSNIIERGLAMYETGHESNLQKEIYLLLMEAGWAEDDVAAELYLDCTRRLRNGKSPGRIDMVVFKPGSHVPFNLYPNGNKIRTNDDEKAKHARALIECKVDGSPKGIEEDLRRLKETSKMLSANGAKAELQLFMAIGAREFDRKSLQTLARKYPSIHLMTAQGRVW